MNIPEEEMNMPLADLKRIDDQLMESVYRELLTPFKWGPVLRGPGGARVDNPRVFRVDGVWYMTYNQVTEPGGYECRLARSLNLTEWEPLGRLLSRGSGGWDTGSVGGFIGLQSLDLDRAYELGTHDGRYWLSYLGGVSDGFEVYPLNIGLAWTSDPTVAIEWTRLEGNPVLSAADSEAGLWENRVLFASHLVRDPGRTLGHPFLLLYNAKGVSDNAERIGLAVSDDLVHWQRPLSDPVLSYAPDHRIAGDPQLLKLGDLYVMLLWIHSVEAGDHETFACSRDLLNWTKWNGTGLTPGRERWEGQTAAHKPWVFRHEGIVYHFFNTTHRFDGRPFGGIGLSTSQFIGKSYQLEEVEIGSASRGHLVERHFDCAGYQGVHFRGAYPGDAIVFTIPLAEPGRYRLKLGYVARSDGGVYRFSFDGAPLPGRVEAASDRDEYREHDFGSVEIVKAGPLAFRAEVIGGVKPASGGGILLDRLDLRKTE